MKHYFFILFSLFLFFGCKETEKNDGQKETVISQQVKYHQDKNYFYLKSGKFNYQIKKNDLPFKKIIFLNSSLLGYVEALNLEEKIVGVSSPEYIFSAKIKNLLNKGLLKDVGNEQKYDIEKILTLKPNAIFTNYVPNFENTYDLLKKNGIKIIFLNEYLEQDPLEKSAYIKVFGELMGKPKRADSVEQNIKKNYLQLKKLANKAQAKPKVLANEMYGNQWFLAGGKSNLANFIADANAHYILENNLRSSAVPLSFEEVYAKSMDAQFWVNVSDHQSKKELLQINPAYAEMLVFQRGNLYSVAGKVNGKANDYFESGLVRADLVLKDYIKIFHPELLPDYHLTYMKKLK